MNRHIGKVESPNLRAWRADEHVAILGRPCHAQSSISQVSPLVYAEKQKKKTRKGPLVSPSTMIQLGYKTWRYLGLTVAMTYAGLGAFDCFAPKRAAKTIFGLSSDGGKEDDAADTAITTLVPLVGVRDLTISTALLYFFHTRQHTEMGVVILSGMLLSAADVVAVWKRKGPAM